MTGYCQFCSFAPRDLGAKVLRSVAEGTRLADRANTVATRGSHSGGLRSHVVAAQQLARVVEWQTRGTQNRKGSPSPAYPTVPNRSHNRGSSVVRSFPGGVGQRPPTSDTVPRSCQEKERESRLSHAVLVYAKTAKLTEHPRAEGGHHAGHVPPAGRVVRARLASPAVGYPVPQRSGGGGAARTCRHLARSRHDLRRGGVTMGCSSGVPSTGQPT